MASCVCGESGDFAVGLIVKKDVNASSNPSPGCQFTCSFIAAWLKDSMACRSAGMEICLAWLSNIVRISSATSTWFVFPILYRRILRR